MYKIKSPESQTKYSWELGKKRLDTHHRYKRNQILGIVQSQRTQKHGNVLQLKRTPI